MIDPIRIFFSPLLLTIIVESGVAFFFGLRNKTEIGAVCLVNVITNPIMNFLLFANYYFNYFIQPTVFLLVLEVVVVLVEGSLLLIILRTDPKKMYVLSIVMNTCSFVAGLLILR